MEEKNFNNFENQQLPNATAVLILGILSIVTCCCYGIFGVAMGGIGLYLSKKDMALYQSNPQAYTNYSNLNTGRILCIIGLILSGISLIFSIISFSIFGFSSDPQEIQNRIQDLVL